ncbi:bifunctional hydroxymethylpyrimidine kinase/phosphomethylpyrimidine kinase [Bordetella trematum]|uniref:bifunctional hydroxymethylpyrimidine kinase/phosphomethylpyrimidine kinase n=1 Tax=Bordetella trematum TaxID=123899 RepID=UPI003AF38134
MIANVLTIAGTDPSGGAGIQADLKTFSALGVYGMSAITAVVAQNTQGVRSFVPLDPAFVADQIDAVFDDVRVDAVKIGMVANAAIGNAIAERLEQRARCPIVLDPVMVAKSGDRLLLPDAVAVLRDRLVPLATLITPNLPEAGDLLQTAEPRTLDAMQALLRALGELGSQWVLLKGGHLESEDSPDLLYRAGSATILQAPRIATRSNHGTGCTLSAAVTALLPRLPLPEAVAQAKDYLTAALAAAGQLQVGQGHGPVHHFHALWR